MADEGVDGEVVSQVQRMLAIEGTWWGGGISQSLGRRGVDDTVEQTALLTSHKYYWRTLRNRRA